MQIIQKFRDQLPRLVTEELEQIIYSIRAYWGVEHKDDGTHKDIHADSITIGGVPITAGGGSGQQTFVTADPETATLPHSRQLKAGTNVTLDKTTPGWLVVNAAGSGGGPGGMNLDYLGDYVPGPIYNDGDIVIAADGVAYMCVVDGTTTPPEPWPGTGVAVNATVDATYWVVSGHAALTNERVMSNLANGYVKSIFGEPSTVAIIPVAEGGTGASTPSNARTNLGVGNVGTLNTNGNANTYLNGTGAWTVPPQNPGVPTGAIILMTVPCPPGYTRVSAWDGRYVRMGPALASGGSASHSHGPGSYAAPAHTHTDGSYSVANHAHSSGSLTVASHTHGSVSVSISGNTGASGAHAHSGTTGGESNGSAVMDAGGGMNCVRAPHVHNFSTNTVADHSHSFSGSGSGATGSASPDVTGDTGQSTADVTGVSGPASATALTGASDARANDPLYVDLYACQKD